MINNINKDLIKVLRKRTSISLIKCKQALIESNGNIELAIDNLRKSGLTTHVNTSNRSTPAGLIAIKMTSNQKKGFIIEINCETDFVSKNSIFQEFIKTVITTALNESINNIDVLRIKFEKQRLLLMNQIGENIQINRFLVLTGDFLSSYVHRSKIGVIVSASGNIDKNIVKNIAMHIAARNPKYLYLNDVPDDIINREQHVQTNIAEKSSKSPEILKKIIKGRMERFINEIVLTKQEFILDTNKKVEHVLDEYCIEINDFIRFEIGDTYSI